MSEDLYAAFFRCSEEELQNPELSLDRQLHNCQPAVAKRGGRIVAFYYEIETGTSRYDQRGKGTDWPAIASPSHAPADCTSWSPTPTASPDPSTT